MLIVDVHPAPELARIMLAGELDLATEDQLRDAIAHAWPAKRIEIDLGKLEYCDSSGVNVLVKAHADAESQSRSLYVVNAHGLVAKVLKVCGVWPHLSGGLHDPDDLDDFPGTDFDGTPLSR